MGWTDVVGGQMSSWCAGARFDVPGTRDRSREGWEVSTHRARPAPFEVAQAHSAPSAYAPGVITGQRGHAPAGPARGPAQTGAAQRCGIGVKPSALPSFFSLCLGPLLLAGSCPTSCCWSDAVTCRPWGAPHQPGRCMRRGGVAVDAYRARRLPRLVGRDRRLGRSSPASRRRPVGPSRVGRGPTAGGGTPRPTPTSTSTAPSSATPASSGARRGCPRPTPACSATSPAGGCSRSAAARPSAPGGCWRPAPTRSALDLSSAMLRRGRELGAGAGLDVPLVQADAARAAVRGRESFDLACSAYGGGAVRRRLGGGDARGRPGAAARRAVGVLGDPSGAVVLPGRPGPGGLVASHSYFDRTPYVEQDAGRASRPTSSTTARSATGCARSSAPGCGWSTWSSRSGRRTTPGPGAQWSPLRGRVIPGTAIFVCEKA